MRFSIVNGGTYSPFALAGCTPDYRLYVHIEYVGETILFGMNRSSGSNSGYCLRKPDGTPVPLRCGAFPSYGAAGYIGSYLEATVGPYPSSLGYTPLDYTINSIADTGNYYLEFNDECEMDYVDITVVNVYPNQTPANEIKGRVFSKSWQWYQYNNSNLSTTLYIYSDDGIVTASQFSNMQIGRGTFYANATGCYDNLTPEENRKSRHQNVAYPQFKIFLNPPDPDPNCYPSGNYGVMTASPEMYPDPAFPCTGAEIIKITVNKTGNIAIKLTFPTPYIERNFASTVTDGINYINWDGRDGSGPPGVLLPDMTNVTVKVTYVNGLTNMPLFDIENNPNGINVTLIRPTGASIQNPKVFWDDSEIHENYYSYTPYVHHVCDGSINDLIGCDPITASPCHPWDVCIGEGNTNGNNHGNTINTWWYSASTSEQTINPTHYALPPDPIPTHASICGSGTVNLSVYVLPGEIAEWYDAAVGGALIHTGTSYSTPNLSQTTTYYVSAKNTFGCYSANRTPVIATINSIPSMPIATSPVNFCGAQQVTINATVASGDRIDWYDATTVGNLLGTGPSYTTGILSAPSSTIYFAEAVTIATTCISLSRTPITVNIKQVPSITVTPSLTAICSGQSTNILLQSDITNATISWNAGSCVNISCPPGGSGPPGSIIQDLLILTDYSLPGSLIYQILSTYDGCASSPIPQPITINALPPVNLATFQPVCLNTLPFSLSGGTPLGGTYTLNNTAITTFNPSTYGVGTYPIIYTYTNPANLCTASTDPQDIEVQDIITPNIYGNQSACVGVAERFTTANTGDPSTYLWNVTPDGTIVAGANPWEKIITWNNAVPTTKNITVIYTDPNGCATTPGSLSVPVNLLPTPILISPNINVCNQRPYTYTTQPGMPSYSWTVSPGNTITPNGNTATVTWNTISPAEWIRVNYVNANGCTAVAPTSYLVNVNPTPMYVVTGDPSVCAGSSSTYRLQSTEKGNWTITSGGSITPPATNVNSISVNWVSGTSPASSSIDVTYTNTLGCAGTTPTNVNIQPLPITTFTASTPSPVCQDYPTPYLYTVDAGGAAATYLWQVNPSSMAVIADATANPAAITWKLSGTTPQTAQLSMTATTSATTPACSATSSPATITINPKPNTQLASCFDLVTSRSAKKFMLKGGSPLLTATPLQGEYLISPATSALTFDGTNYYFDPSLVSVPMSFDISYKYTSARYGCPATSTPVTISVLGLNPPCGSTMTDPRNGISYRTSSSLVPGKCWMVENLRYGQSPPTATSPQTDNCIAERNCLTSDPTCVNLGGFYQWDELIQYGLTAGPAYQGVCPPGWHIPSAAEWTELIDAVVNLPGVPGDGLAGSYLKDQNITNGFDALVNGIYYLDNVWAYTTGTLTGTMFWTSTQDAIYSDRMVARGVNNINYSVSNYPASRANAFPVRCVKD